MPKLTDNELDKLFRDAADRNSPAFDPQDWDDMAKRLEHEERAARARSTTLYSLVALLLIYALLPQWGGKPGVQTASVFQSQTTENLTRVKDVETKDDVAEAYTSPQQNIQRAVNDQTAGQLVATAPASSDHAIHSKEATLEDRQQSKTVGHTVGTTRDILVAQTDYTNRSPVVEDSKNQNTVNTKDTAHDQQVTGGSPAQQTNTIRSQSEITTGYDIVGYETQPVQGFIPAAMFAGGAYYGAGMMVIEDSITIDAPRIIQPVAIDAIEYDAKTIIRPEQPTLSHKWFVKVAASPDFSSIDYAKPGDPGVNIGVLGEYQFSNHFSLSTGAIWSKKLYDLDNPDKSYGSGGYVSKAKTLNGDCRVLDIPINVTYYLFPQRRTNLFVTVGTSSYIMLKEQYIYTVWANHKEYRYEENYAHENNEWFSMLNVSIGIQYRLTKHFLIQGEPFLKAPISGVGEGKVNLMSTGVFFALKYQISHY